MARRLALWLVLLAAPVVAWALGILFIERPGPELEANAFRRAAFQHGLFAVAGMFALALWEALRFAARWKARLPWRSLFLCVYWGLSAVLFAITVLPPGLARL